MIFIRLKKKISDGIGGNFNAIYKLRFLFDIGFTRYISLRTINANTYFPAIYDRVLRDDYNFNFSFDFLSRKEHPS